jgi:hypothetical protein
MLAFFITVKMSGHLYLAHFLTKYNHQKTNNSSLNFN